MDNWGVKAPVYTLMGYNCSITLALKTLRGRSF